MSHEYLEFIKNSEQKANNKEHFNKLYNNISKYDSAVAKGKPLFADIDALKTHANSVKKEAIYHLDKYLLQFEANAKKNNIEVIWAENAKEATKSILKICKEVSAKSVVKGKSMVTEELHLNDALEDNKIAAIETDLGEYIQQLDGESPYHILTPAMHKTKEEIATLFHKKLGVAPDLPPNELTMIARKKLREKFSNAEVGITGCNFILPDIGGIALTENEGNIRLSFGFPKVHIAVAGIEKVIPSFKDLGAFWPLLALHGTGQKMTTYNSIITGPRKENENVGPEKMVVILLDNNRTALMKDEKLIESMFCIRCGACLNICPIYKNIGGLTYGTTYSGPIGSVISPHLKGMKEYGHLSFASSLCGSCSEVCPVKIDLHGLLLKNRIDYQTLKPFKTERWVWKLWSIFVRKPKLINIIPSFVKTTLMKRFFTQWNKKRASLFFARHNTFQLWKKYFSKH